MTTLSRSLQLVAGLALLVQLSGCTSQWTMMEPPPPAGAKRLRILPAGQTSWMEVQQPLVVGDTALVWIPDARRERMVPPELAELYRSGRIALRDVTAVAVNEGPDCGTGCKVGIGVLGTAAGVALGAYVFAWIIINAIKSG